MTACHPLDEVGRLDRYDRRAATLGSDGVGHGDLVQVRQRRVDGAVVELNDLVALDAVGLLDGALDLRNRLVARQNARDGEEAGLHDRIGAPAHAAFLSDGGGVDAVDLELLLDDRLLDLAREALPGLFGTERGVDQEGRARLGKLDHLVLVEEDPLVTGDEVGLLDEVARTNRSRSEAQVGDGDRAGFLRVVDEVALGVVVGLFTDDLDGVLVGADGAVGTESEEDAAEDVLGRDVEVVVDLEGCVGDIVDDADGEVVLGFVGRQVVEDRLDHRRVELFRRQAVAAADQNRLGGEGIASFGARLGEHGQHVDVHRLADVAGLLGAVHDRDRLDGLRQRREE